MIYNFSRRLSSQHQISVDRNGFGDPGYYQLVEHDDPLGHCGVLNIHTDPELVSSYARNPIFMPIGATTDSPSRAETIPSSVTDKAVVFQMLKNIAVALHRLFDPFCEVMAHDCQLRAILSYQAPAPSSDCGP
ncbi:MAG: hypothetical protein KJZ93_02970 [Caldilineaceae bacterium]|nr:hypothetical protein [Caldilineaceae bacterium]